MPKKYPKTIVLRSRRENVKKCSLRGLESREDFLFLTYPRDRVPDLNGYILLALDAPPLDSADAKKGLLVLDATWRIVQKMMKFVLGAAPGLPVRTIPYCWRTAYPRKQPDCPRPELGLASVEAIFAAYKTLGRDVSGLLDYYYWKTSFLLLNGSCRAIPDHSFSGISVPI